MNVLECKHQGNVNTEEKKMPLVCFKIVFIIPQLFGVFLLVLLNHLCVLSGSQTEEGLHCDYKSIFSTYTDSTKDSTNCLAPYSNTMLKRHRTPSPLAGATPTKDVSREQMQWNKGACVRRCRTPSPISANRGRVNQAKHTWNRYPHQEQRHPHSSTQLADDEVSSS